MTKKTNSPSEKEETKDEVVKKINSVEFLFEWVSLQPDVRPYKPSNPYLTPEKPLFVMIAVPLDSTLLVNAQAISIEQMTSQPVSEPILTPLGMRYIIDQFEDAMKNGKQDTELSVQSSEDDEDWGDEPEVEKKAESAKASDNEWNDEDETDQSGVEKPEEDFDEDWS